MLNLNANKQYQQTNNIQVISYHKKTWLLFFMQKQNAYEA